MPLAAGKPCAIGYFFTSSCYVLFLFTWRAVTPVGAGRSAMQASRRRLQVRTQRLTLVEHEAVAAVMRAADFLEILEDAAFELVHVLDADCLHVDGGLFAADAAGAERHHGLAGIVGQVFGQPRGKFAE